MQNQIKFTPNNLKFPKLSKPLIYKHPGINCFQRKILCDIEYNKGDPLEYGLLLQTYKMRNIEYYSIATGKIGEKKNKKYYEVYPELYNAKDARIVVSALEMIKWADTPVVKDERIYADK